MITPHSFEPLLIYWPAWYAVTGAEKQAADQILDGAMTSWWRVGLGWAAFFWRGVYPTIQNHFMWYKLLHRLVQPYVYVYIYILYIYIYLLIYFIFRERDMYPVFSPNWVWINRHQLFFLGCGIWFFQNSWEDHDVNFC